MQQWLMFKVGIIYKNNINPKSSKWKKHKICSMVRYFKILIVQIKWYIYIYDWGSLMVKIGCTQEKLDPLEIWHSKLTKDQLGLQRINYYSTLVAYTIFHMRSWKWWHSMMNMLMKFQNSNITKRLKPNIKRRFKFGKKKLKWYRKQALEITYLVEMHIFTLDIGKESIFFQSDMKPIKSWQIFTKLILKR